MRGNYSTINNIQNPGIDDDDGWRFNSVFDLQVCLKASTRIYYIIVRDAQCYFPDDKKIDNYLALMSNTDKITNNRIE